MNFIYVFYLCYPGTTTKFLLKRQRKAVVILAARILSIRNVRGGTVTNFGAFHWKSHTLSWLYFISHDNFLWINKAWKGANQRIKSANIFFPFLQLRKRNSHQTRHWYTCFYWFHRDLAKYKLLEKRKDALLKNLE
jgi:hypothetical protein